MSDAQKIMADVIGLHRLEKCIRASTSERTEWWQCLGCEWKSEEFDLDDTEVRREIERVKRAHLAAEIDKALGGLGRAWAAVLPDDSYFGPYHEAHEISRNEARMQAESDVAEYEDATLKWVDTQRASQAAIDAMVRHMGPGF